MMDGTFRKMLWNEQIGLAIEKVPDPRAVKSVKNPEFWIIFSRILPEMDSWSNFWQIIVCAWLFGYAEYLAVETYESGSNWDQ